MSTTMLDGQYPTAWSEYVGQETAKHQLRVAARSAKMRGDNLPHILISSPYAGIGKTALAMLTCAAVGRPVVPVSGSLDINGARMLFADLEDGDVVFYDEFHKVMDGGKRRAEWLLHYLENGVLMTPFGAEQVARVSFVAATTDKGLILPTILDRFKVVDLDPYSDTEGAAIAERMSSKVLEPASLPGISSDVAFAVARACSNQPRRMRDLLVSVRDLAVVGEIPAPQDGSYTLGLALEFAGFTEDGLTKDAASYLRLMIELRGQPAGEALLRNRLGVVGQGLKLIELLLIGKDYIALTKQGRMLTTKGLRRAKELTAAA